MRLLVAEVPLEVFDLPERRAVVGGRVEGSQREGALLVLVETEVRSVVFLGHATDQRGDQAEGYRRRQSMRGALQLRYSWRFDHMFEVGPRVVCLVSTREDKDRNPRISAASGLDRSPPLWAWNPARSSH